MPSLASGFGGLLLMGLGFSSCTASGPPVPLAQLDPSSVAGGWYIVATIPNVLEHGIVAPHDNFTPRGDGAIREDFTMRRGGFASREHHFTVRITVRPDTGNADWRVHLFGPVILPFQVLYVDPAQKFLLFGEQNRQWGWIYSRTRTIGDADYRAMLGHFKALGYDPSKFRKFIQTPDQIGQPGFWSDGVTPAAASPAPAKAAPA